MKTIKIILAMMLMQLPVQIATAQEKGQIVRLAKLVIDSVYLESYKEFLTEGIENRFASGTGGIDDIRIV